jgi:hypothetical protein
MPLLVLVVSPGNNTMTLLNTRNDTSKQYRLLNKEEPLLLLIRRLLPIDAGTGTVVVGGRHWGLILVLVQELVFLLERLARIILLEA